MGCFPDSKIICQASSIALLAIFLTAIKCHKIPMTNPQKANVIQPNPIEKNGKFFVAKETAPLAKPVFAKIGGNALIMSKMAGIKVKSVVIL